MEDIIEDFCKNLKCSFIALDLEKLNHARDMLTQLQYNDIFSRVLGPEANVIDGEKMEPQERQQRLSQLGKLLSHHADSDPKAAEQSSDVNSVSDDLIDQHEEGEVAEEHIENVPCDIADVISEENYTEDTWQGYFRGFQILHNADEYNTNGQKKCIELTKNDCDADINQYLRSGVRCFAIDLSNGTDWENQTIIVRLRENEIKVSNEFGYPVSATLIAKISPRMQYTGLLMPLDNVVKLEPNDELTLTTDRYWSSRGTRRRVYVNARNLIDDVRPFDILLIGGSIQAQVRYVLPPDRLRCLIMVGGELKSRMPVLFPGRCNRFRISTEELEDITFAKEVGINVIVAHMAGTVEYFTNLKKCIKLLHCDKMRLWARVVLNEMPGCPEEMNWVAESYDGLYIELTPQQFENVCEDEKRFTPVQTEVLRLSWAADTLLERAYELHRPIIMDPSAIAQRYLVVPPKYRMHVFYYPDKYLIRCDRSSEAFYFDQLQNATFVPLIAEQLEPLDYCDSSYTGSDSLARACVASAIEMAAAYILVTGHTGRMAEKIAHFRPTIPVLFVTPMKSASDFISVYHHVTMLYYRNSGSGGDDEPYRRAVYKQMLLGLMYGKARKIMRTGQIVMLVYDIDADGTKCPNTYVSFKFHEKHFADHLKTTLFLN